MNLYAYCGNNPVERLDPSGLFEESELDAWEQLSGAKGFLNAFSAGWSKSANDSRNTLLAQAGADDYACKSPLGMEAVKYGSITTAGMMLDFIPMSAIGFIDDVAKAGSKAVNAGIVNSAVINIKNPVVNKQRIGSALKRDIIICNIKQKPTISIYIMP